MVYQTNLKSLEKIIEKNSKEYLVFLPGEEKHDDKAQKEVRGKKNGKHIECPNCQRIISKNPIIQEAVKGIRFN